MGIIYVAVIIYGNYLCCSDYLWELSIVRTPIQIVILKCTTVRGLYFSPTVSKTEGPKCLHFPVMIL
jgi:hypothetical protein